MIFEKLTQNKLILPVLVAATLTFSLMALAGKVSASDNKKHDLSLSDMQVKITSKGHTANFRLYDTAAAEKFYDQLPLKLDLSNFGNVMWTFKLPEKLDITPGEAYHDGIKGELGYYEPWGVAFMLYEDFHAGDEMHRLGIGLSGQNKIFSMSGIATIEKDIPTTSGEKITMQIQVTANGTTTVFELNNSTASRELYAQLPLTIKVENYSNSEKIFYPPKKLNISGTPLADARTGTLAYYAPWGDVVMFFGNFGSAGGLYELGKAVSGTEYIQDMSGEIKIQQK